MNPEKIKEQLIELLNVGVLLPGSIKKQWNVCGMPGCKCKDPVNPQKHGPYYQLSFTLGGKSSTMFVTDEEYERMLNATDRYRKFRDLSLQLVQAYVDEERQIRKKRKERRSKKNKTNINKLK